MGLSLEKLFPDAEEHEENEWLQIELAESRLRLKADDKVGQRLEECWPSFSFLKGMGFENVVFRTRDPQIIGDWAYRIESYEQNYIEDPEYLHVNELIWNEKDSDDKLLIECVARTGAMEMTPANAGKWSTSSVPPMQAPLGVSQTSIDAFVAEAKNYDSEQTLQRIRSILNEYTREKNSITKSSWYEILFGVVRVCLEESALDRALQISEEHKDDFGHILSHNENILQLLSLYDPKSHQIDEWTRLFSSLSIERLISLLEAQVSSKAKANLIRLMNSRATLEHEKIIHICFRSPAPLQKLLLQWLTSYWSPHHYRDILRALKSSLERDQEVELIPHWVQALMRSYRQQALDDLKKLFVPKTWLRFLKIAPPRLGRLQQLSLLAALSELRSAEVLILLKEIKPFLRGENADQVEKIIQSYRMSRTS